MIDNFIYLIVIAQIIFAVVAVLDKYIVTSGKVAEPIIYSFYTNILSASSLLFFFGGLIPLPFNLSLPSFSNVVWPSASFLIISFVASISQVLSFWALFTAFKYKDVSDIVPIFQSMIAISSALIAFVILGAKIQGNFLPGFILLVIGTFLVSRFRLGLRSLGLALVSGFLLAVNIFITDILADADFFSFSSRDNAYFWMSITTGLSAFLLMLSPSFHLKPSSQTKHPLKHSFNLGNVLAVVGNKTLAGVAAFIILTAVTIASPSEIPIINSLGGLQFLFLLIFSIVVGNKTPYACGENCTKREKIQKLVSVGIIIIGFAILFI